MQSTQKSVFTSGQEGDRYFSRNEGIYAAMVDADELSIPNSVYASYIRAGDAVLEIGSSSGTNLDALRRATGCAGFGIDPSAKAISSGSALHPGLNLSVGTADKLEFPDHSFDFILFGFCLYLVDRDLLSRVVAEADRCLKDGGFLGITDFAPDVPTKRPYAHRSGVFTHKYQYERMFTAFPHFSVVESRPFSHSGRGFHPDPQERLTATVIHKNLAGGYQSLA
ncbi:class I SAM-dependent methyltransferase [Achromobacter xylosoxidans]|uniref:class I SAM-dependent methyltransferase n=1 Tax=Alcaligenes xylosoxydans xylosoxydans TaxID=85698 RepID=UPI0011DCEE82|nr:class I SAM-dependent methyltransferase [Achromobacter xylosoxidans]